VITFQKPQLPTSSVSRHRTFNIAITLLLALIFNGALALLIELLSDRAADLDEFERITGLPVLATVPKLTFSDRPAMEVSPRAGNADVLPGKMLRPRRASPPVREARGG
jgi:hypothetical protein